MPSIFTRIVNGEIPSYKIAEDEKHYAFLDINPLQIGHTLVIPKREVDYIFDLDPQELAELNVFAQRVARAIEAVIDCNRIGVTVMGLEVPHAHIHLIPINRMADMDFTKTKAELSTSEFQDLAKAISEKFV